MAVVEEFCLAAKDKWPDCLIQFEDFQTEKAFAILERFREKFLCFNGARSHAHCLPKFHDCHQPLLQVMLVWSLLTDADVSREELRRYSTRYDNMADNIVVYNADDIQGTGAVVTAG